MPATKKNTPKNAKTKKTLPVKAAKKSAKRPAASPTKAGEKLVTIDRRRTPDRRAGERSAMPQRPPLERRAKVNRRRQIDPTTCERDYTLEEIEFMKALDDYKRANGRMFPTCSEVLEVIHKLGYEKRPSPVAVAVSDAVAPDAPPPAAAV